MRKESPSFVIPALFTRTSNPPLDARASFTTAVTCSAFPTSAQISVKVVPFSFAKFSSSSLEAEGFEQSPQTVAPFPKKVFTISFPIPRLEPVTNIFFPFNILFPSIFI